MGNNLLKPKTRIYPFNKINTRIKSLLNFSNNNKNEVFKNSNYYLIFYPKIPYLDTRYYRLGKDLLSILFSRESKIDHRLIFYYSNTILAKYQFKYLEEYSDKLKAKYLFSNIQTTNTNMLVNKDLSLFLLDKIKENTKFFNEMKIEYTKYLGQSLYVNTKGKKKQNSLYDVRFFNALDVEPYKIYSFYLDKLGEDIVEEIYTYLFTVIKINSIKLIDIALMKINYNKNFEEMTTLEYNKDYPDVGIIELSEEKYYKILNNMMVFNESYF